MIALDGRSLTPADFESVCLDGAPVALADRAFEGLHASRAVVERLVAAGTTSYGINTGFGHLARVRIAESELRALQVNLLRSHAVGVGAPFDVPTTRGILLLRANVLAAGRSGVRADVVLRLLELLNRGIHPVVPSQGSVGASGDLAPLAHVALLLIGEGEVFAAGGTEPADVALARAGLAPLTLEAKEGLALINGTQAMTALGLLAVQRARRLADTADTIAAMTVEAKLGSWRPFDERLQAVRPHAGQARTAANLRTLLQGGTINDSHANCARVQDPYSLRCVPQVHGASRDAIEHVGGVLEIELNSVTDNPTVFADDGAILSGGNFHGAPVAMALDYLAIAVAELGSISERRIEQLVSPRLDDFPAFLAGRPGLDSGYMMAQVTAAALASENKGLCHPASVDSIPTSASQEDHVSMGPIAARKALAVVANVEVILGIELLVAAQALDLRRPLVPARGPAWCLERLRAEIPALTSDRLLHPELMCAAELVRSGAFLPALRA